MEDRLIDSLKQISETKAGGFVVITVDDSKQKFLLCTSGSECGQEALSKASQVEDRAYCCYILATPSQEDAHDSLCMCAQTCYCVRMHSNGIFWRLFLFNADLVQYCPDGISAREKMTLSTAKASLSENLKSVGVNVTNFAQAFDQDDLQNIFTETSHGSDSMNGDSPAVSPSGTADEQPKIARKPRRPGRGKARLIR